ncbi:MAG: hypothetical protein K6E14_08045 [Paludibacteraceae bacterium]|nr:hypothetical protein [Paludibacteraceae bacterium]
MAVGYWLIAYGRRLESFHAELMKSDYFRNFADLHPLKAFSPTETFFSKLAIINCFVLPSRQSRDAERNVSTSSQITTAPLCGVFQTLWFTSHIIDI